MQWEEMTAPDFARAVREIGVCIMAMGVIERHGDHLPLGTDFLNGHRLACMAAQKEPAVVFPPFYFGQIYEARCYPGTVTVKPALLMEMIRAVLDEIGRNGFTKVILLNAHGGNRHLLPFLVDCTMWEERPYRIYLPKVRLSEERQRKWREICETDLHGHACECETSISLANHPDLVRMERVPDEPGSPLGRLDHLPPTHTGIGWYSDYPRHYAGDARSATREKGRALRQLLVDELAEYIRAVKEDGVVPALSREFFRRTGSPADPGNQG